jgi:hypothetical protein
MRSIVPSFFLLLFLPALCFGAPVIDFESPSYDFGVVGGQDTVRHVFAFSDRGDRELVIQKLSPS